MGKSSNTDYVKYPTLLGTTTSSILVTVGVIYVTVVPVIVDDIIVELVEVTVCCLPLQSVYCVVWTILNLVIWVVPFTTPHLCVTDIEDEGAIAVLALLGSVILNSKI